MERTSKRKERILELLKNRQFDLHLVLENIHDPHNVSAILRTCDSVGIDSVSLVYYVEKFPKIGKKSSASAWKWVRYSKYSSVIECVSVLRGEGYKILGTKLDIKAKRIYDINYTEKVAIVVGNEHRGISEEFEKECDSLIYIPMLGMVQSLNVSVASAVVLYEALRQRLESNMYNKNIDFLSGDIGEDSIINERMSELIRK